MVVAINRDKSQRLPCVNEIQISIDEKEQKRDTG